jgi:hypothetical protein
MLRIMSEVALLLPNTDQPQQVEDYVRGCTTSSEYWPTSTGWILCQRLNIMSEVALLLANTDRPQSAEDYVRGCITSSEYWPTSTGWRLCQRLHYFYQILTIFNKLKIMLEVALLLPNTDQFQQVEGYVRGCTTSTKYWPPSTSWRICQRLYYFYRILTDLNRLKIMSEVEVLLSNTDDFNKLKIISEVALLLPNTDRLQLVEEYMRGCTT